MARGGAGSPKKGQDGHPGAVGAGGMVADSNFGVLLEAEARAILNDARAVLTNPGLTGSQTVHALRRALKRWRALMRLLSGPVGEPAERLRVEARALMRALSGSRDAQAALDALADLDKSEIPLSATSRKAIATRLLRLRSEAEAAGFTTERRRQAIRYIEDSEREMSQWSLATIEFDAVAEALTLSYRRGRRRIPSQWLSAEPDALHELRKRAVEYRHQIELLEPLQPKFIRERIKQAQRLRERLGACQDLVVLEALTAPHAPLARWRGKLVPLIAARRERHLGAASEIASELFAEKPKAFREQLEALRLRRESAD